MLPFSVKVSFFRLKMKILKLVAELLPFPKPTLFNGPGSSLELCRAIEQMGLGKVLIVTDAMLVKLGLIDGMKAALDEAGIEVTVYDGVQPDPTVDQIEAGLAMLKANACEAILAIGGGSSIDAAKVIAARATTGKAVAKMDGLFKIRQGILPLFAVPTTAGTGSEVTVAAVVSNPAEKKKSAIMDPQLVPMMAALDGQLMTGLPAPITAATGMDALTHAVEAYVSRNALADTDRYAIAAVRLIMKNLPVAYENGADVEARQSMAMASYYAALAFTRAGVGYVHAIAHNLGAYYHTPHGLANAIVMPYVLEFSRPDCRARLADLARASGLGAAGDSEDALAGQFIEQIRAMNRSFGIPEKHDKLQASDVPAIAKAALKEAHSTYAVPRYMDQDECEQLVRQLIDTGELAQAA